MFKRNRIRRPAAAVWLRRKAHDRLACPMCEAPSVPHRPCSVPFRFRRAAAWAALCFVLAAMPTVASPAGGEPRLEEVARRHYAPEVLERGRAYRRVGYALFFAEALVTLVAVWGVAGGFAGGLGARAMSLTGGRPWLGRVFAVGAVVFGMSLLRLGFAAVRYLHARAYGLRSDGWAAFLADQAKALGVGWVLAIALGTALLGLYAAWPQRWWWMSALVTAVLVVGYAGVGPLVVDPLFHRFRPLEDRALASRVLELGREAGVRVDRVLVADASRRTRAVNAYFTGLGSTRRIVLYDTLVERFPPEEVALVVAHEIGHWKHHHLAKGLALGLAGVALGLWVGQWFLGTWVAQGWGGITGRADPGLAAPLYALVVTGMLAATVPANWVSRRMETEADRTALELTRDPETFVRTEVRLGRENLADVVPPRWIEFLLYTHPANARRILMGEEWK